MVKTNILNVDCHLLSEECYDRGYYRRKYLTSMVEITLRGELINAIISVRGKLFLET